MLEFIMPGINGEALVSFCVGSRCGSWSEMLCRHMVIRWAAVAIVTCKLGLN